MQARGEALLPIAVVIPCYKVRQHIATVLTGLAGRVQHAYVIDDCCPEHTGRFVQETPWDIDVTVVFLPDNQGVGAAVLAGYRRALADGYEIIVKLDGDNQMNPAYLSALVAPLVLGQADYAKGNRFFDVYSLSAMPAVRLAGNSVLSFIMKLASGYWDIMDPTNGYTAIHCVALSRLPLDRLDPRYFFECDMLFRLATIRAVVMDVAMPTLYADETSNLKISRVLLQFPGRFAIRIVKRFFYLYLLRDFNMGSIETLAGLPLVLFGIIFGIWHWVRSVTTGQLASTGTVMLAVLPLVVGVQLLLAALGVDIANRPETPLQRRFGIAKVAIPSSVQRHDLP